MFPSAVNPRHSLFALTLKPVTKMSHSEPPLATTLSYIGHNTTLRWRHLPVVTVVIAAGPDAALVQHQLQLYRLRLPSRLHSFAR